MNPNECDKKEPTSESYKRVQGCKTHLRVCPRTVPKWGWVDRNEVCTRCPEIWEKKNGKVRKKTSKN